MNPIYLRKSTTFRIEMNGANLLEKSSTKERKGPKSKYTVNIQDT